MIEIVEDKKKSIRTNTYKPTKNSKKKVSKNYSLVYLVISVIFFSSLFLANWANQPKEEKEILYQNLLNRQENGVLAEDSIPILCKLAKELKKEIPKICSEKKYSYAKKSGKNEKHKNKKAKESAEEKMIFWKNQKDSLGRLQKDPKGIIKNQLQKANNQYERFRKKFHEQGETHSRKGKGK